MKRLSRLRLWVAATGRWSGRRGRPHGQGRQRAGSQRRRQRGADQGSQGHGHLDDAQGRHQDQGHPAGGW